MPLLIQKQTGEDAASCSEIEEFNIFCEKLNADTFTIYVSDEEHEILSLDSKRPFLVSKNAKVYSTVMEAYYDTVDLSKQDEKNIYIEMLVLISEKFDQNKEAKKVLMSTTGIIVYKTEDDNYWGSRVPEFDGQNIAGEIMVKLRDLYYS